MAVHQTCTDNYQNSRYIVGTGTFPTIQAAINEANANGSNSVVFVRPGTYTENLTLYDSVNLEGAENTITTIIGTHTPPNSGSVNFTRLTLASATNILSSASAGSTALTFNGCRFNTTNGYVCSLANWTGPITIKYCSDISTKNGIITNTGGSNVTISNSIIGVGTGAMSISGASNELFNTKIGCPIAVTDNSSSIFEGGSSFAGTISTASNAALIIANSRIATGAVVAITHASSAVLYLNNVVINTSNNPAIGGTGSVQFSEATFVNSSALAGTITEVLTGSVKTGEIYANTILRMEFSGFYSWAASGPYFDDTTLGTFQLLVGGMGYIKGKIVTWVAQNITGLTAGNTYFIYIDSTGTIGKSSTRTDTLFTDNIVLFECMRDSTIGTNLQVTVKENHPYSFPTSDSDYLHDVVGTVIENTNNGANITLTGTQKIYINGDDVMTDHGLYTNIPTTATPANGETWHRYYTNASGKWAQQNATTTFTGYWNNAGTPTALSGNRWAVYTLYATKDSLNTTTPLYIAVLDVAQYGNLAAAQTAISNGTTAKATAELAFLELVQLGYITYRQSTAAIDSVIISKSTLKQTLSSSGSNNASLIITNVTNFDGILSAADTNVQAALETIDDFGKNLTDKALVVGNGNGNPLGVISVGATGTILTGVTSNDPTWTTATYPATAATGDILAATGTNVIGVIDGTTATANYVLTGNGSGVLPSWKVAAGGGLTWGTATANLAPMLVNHGYVINKAGTACSCALPTTAAVGDLIQITGYGATGWVITQAAGQQVNLGSTLTTSGATGTITSTNRYDCITLRCIVANTTFAVESAVGNLTFA